ncbi:hypothetical protein TRFO_27619 [Tritrichomonas foetus]|uniref:SP-RING-type domain-containing protein n=1 Tax=Tritrichomonas foetus TaxID=1144522 RepID=A0A1J4K0Q0_9EUKA|nr:hypothetical protein TRFO_27619 [Tritrichomonas foetus]|eukprot:OHT04827.1 hypothetical protein TRFO_27619 [Tritrichomonas foetus]
MAFTTQNHTYILNQLQESINSCGDTWKYAKELEMPDIVAKSKQAFSSLIDLQQEFQIYTDILRGSNEGETYDEILHQVSNQLIMSRPILDAQKIQLMQARDGIDSGQNRDDNDEDVEFKGGDSTSGLICPITAKLPDHPVISTVCHHVYDRDAIFNYISQKNPRGYNHAVECPLSTCKSFITRDSIREDPEITRKVREAKKKEAEENDYEKL